MKKMSNKITTAILILLITVSVISCGSTPKAEKGTAAEDKKTEEAKTTESGFIIRNPETDYIEPTLPTTDCYYIDDFEEGNYWYGVGNTWDQWGSHNLSLTADLNKDWKAGGTYSLKCTMEAATADTSKQATWCGTPADPDLSGYKWVAVDIYNPEDFEYELNIAIQNKMDWAWEETEHVLVPTGVHTALFDISHMKEEYMECVYVFMIQSVNEHDAGTIYFDNFRMYE